MTSEGGPTVVLDAGGGADGARYCWLRFFSYRSMLFLLFLLSVCVCVCVFEGNSGVGLDLVLDRV